MRLVNDDLLTFNVIFSITFYSENIFCVVLFLIVYILKSQTYVLITKLQLKLINVLFI